MNKKVSVVMTVYNKPQWLAEAIDSVLAQTYTNWELILMEDNSPDPKVREIMESYNDSRIIKYFSGVAEEDRYKTARYATLINIAVREFATGDYITYLTDDDFFYPQRLAVMVEALESPDVHVVYGQQQVVDADGNHAGVRGTRGVLDTAFNVVDHNSVMHTREAFDKANGWYDVPGVWGGADAYFWRRLNEAGYLFYPIDSEPLDAKRYHTESVQWQISNHCFYPGDK